MKNLVGVISNDIHISLDNYEKRKELLLDQVSLCVKEKVPMILLGDIFDSRSSQRSEVLNAFTEVMLAAKQAEVDVIMIPGNHDKTVYNSVNSFLNPFSGFPNVMLIKEPHTIHLKYIRATFFPFFDTDTWMKYWNETISSFQKEDGIKDVLLTHIAISGSVNNDGSKVESTIKESMLKKYFDLVVSGHYHDQQRIGIFHHLPSVCQNNYGENEDKGYTLLYSDLSMELVKSKSDRYKVYQIDMSEIKKKDIPILIDQYRDSAENVRFEFKGNEAQIKSLDKSLFLKEGIDFKTKQISEEEEEFQSEIIEITETNVVEEFEQWCESKSIDHKRGIKYLNQVLQKQKS